MVGLSGGDMGELLWSGEVWGFWEIIGEKGRRGNQLTHSPKTQPQPTLTQIKKYIVII